jgi:type IV pilus assembly protein PilQ
MIKKFFGLKDLLFRGHRVKAISIAGIMFIFCFLLFTIFGFVTASFAKETADENSGLPQITAIEIADYTLRIKVNGPINYNINKTEDPFRVNVEIKGVALGKFKEKIFSKSAGITEVAPVQIENASRLELLLQSPSGIKSEVKDDMLVLYIEEKANSDKSPEYTKKTNKEEKASGIIDVILDKTADGVEVVIKGDGKMAEPAVYEINGKIILDIPGVAMKASLPTKTVSPIKDIKYRAEKDGLRFMLDVEGKLDTEVFVVEDELIVDIAFKDIQTKKAVSAKKEEVKGKLVDGSKLISLDFQDADIVPIFRLLGDVGGYNIVVHPDVKGKVTMKLMNVQWEQALEVVLKTFNLEKIVEGNLIRIATVKAFQEEKKAVAETREVFGKAEDITSRVFVVNYANVDKVRESIDKAKVLSPRGNISADTRTRSLIVKDIPSRIEEIQKLIDILDKPTPQVLIEARLVEVSSNFSKDLGVQWGVDWKPSDTRTTISGARDANIDVTQFTSSPKTAVGTGEVLSGSQTMGGGTKFPLNVNLPAAVGAGTGGTLALGYISAGSTFLLDFRLSALESSGKGKIVSNPKIMTVDNEKAIIQQGKKIPVSTVSAEGTKTEFIDANLNLTVTPQIGPDNTVLLKIEAKKNEPDFSRTVNNIPTIDVKEASTQVLLKDGETVVIGGIFKSTESETEAGVPLLSKIPLLGWLFKREAKSTTSEELLIFITPRIVRR